MVDLVFEPGKLFRDGLLFWLRLTLNILVIPLSLSPTFSINGIFWRNIGNPKLDHSCVPEGYFVLFCDIVVLESCLR